MQRALHLAQRAAVGGAVDGARDEAELLACGGTDAGASAEDGGVVGPHGAALVIEHDDLAEQQLHECRELRGPCQIAEGGAGLADAGPRSIPWCCQQLLELGLDFGPNAGVHVRGRDADDIGRTDLIGTGHAVFLLLLRIVHRDLLLVVVAGPAAAAL